MNELFYEALLLDKKRAVSEIEIDKDTEAANEKTMYDKGIERYERTFNNLAHDSFNETTAGQRIFIGIFKEYVERVRLENEVEGNGKELSSASHYFIRQLIDGMSVEKICFIALTVILRNLLKPTTFQNCVCSVANEIQLEYAVKEWHEKVDEKRTRYLMKQVEQGARYRRFRTLTTFTRRDGCKGIKLNKVQEGILGAWMLNKLIETSNILEVVIQSTGAKASQKVSMVRPTKETREWIEGFNETMRGLRPRYSPMLCQPRNWTSIYDGGYMNQFGITAIKRMK